MVGKKEKDREESHKVGWLVALRGRWGLSEKGESKQEITIGVKKDS